jgi:pimeloyl-ACP methyl ester carboxylesterase
LTTPTTGDARDEHVIAGGPRFHYRAWGDERAPDVLLLHGLTGNAWEWDPIAAVLSRRFHVLALNQRGHGASPWARDYAAERMVDDLARITAELELKSLALVGHSMGALNGLLCAARHPQLVERLVIVDFGPDSMTPEATGQWTASLRAAAQASFSDPREALAEWLAANPRARERHLLHFVIHNLGQGTDGRWRWRFDTVGLKSFLDQIPGEPVQWAALRDVACPTLVLRGEHSEVLTAQTAARMGDELPSGKVVEIPGGGHDLTVEQPEALATAVDQFLTGNREIASGVATAVTTVYNQSRSA